MSPPSPVCIVIEAFSARLGGGQTYLRNLLERLPDDEHLQVYIYAPESLHLPEKRNLTRLSARWPVTNPVLRAIWQLLLLPWVLRRLQADILFCPGGLVVTPVPRQCRVVTMFRNMAPFDADVRRALSPLRRLRVVLLYHLLLRSMRIADLTIFISESGRNRIEKLTSVKRGVTIHHGINPAFLKGDRSSPPAGLAEDGYLLYVSRFDVYKHQDTLVKAFAMLPQSVRRTVPLVLVGEDEGAEADRVRRLIHDLDIDSDVRILGAIPYVQLPAYYQHALINVFMSSCENCPNILLEAMAAGRPVVCSSVDPMPEFGGNAVAYVSPFDARDVAGVLEKLLSDGELRTRMGVLAGTRAEDFDWDQTASQTWAVLMQQGSRYNIA